MVICKPVNLCRSASSPHMGAVALQQQQALQQQRQPLLGGHAAAVQHPSYGSLSSFAPPHPRPLPAPSELRPDAAGSAVAAAPPHNYSHPNLASLGGGLAGGAGGDLAERFSASGQHAAPGAAAFDATRPGAGGAGLEALRAAETVRAASGGFAAGAVGGLDSLRSG